MQRLCYKELADMNQEKNEATDKMICSRTELAVLREQGVYMQAEVRAKLGLSSSGDTMLLCEYSL